MVIDHRLPKLEETSGDRNPTWLITAGWKFKGTEFNQAVIPSTGLTVMTAITHPRIDFVPNFSYLVWPRDLCTYSLHFDFQNLSSVLGVWMCQFGLRGTCIYLIFRDHAFMYMNTSCIDFGTMNFSSNYVHYNPIQYSFVKFLLILNF